ncbi:MAG: hypothetical protein WC299_10570 [Kiritimatiellia bacterium]
MTPVVWFGAGAVVAGILYTIIVHRWGKDERWSWWHGFVSTLISVLLGVVVAVWLFQFQRVANDRDTRARLVALLRSELADSYRYLTVNNNNLNVECLDTNFVFQLFVLQPIILEEAAKSGLFTEIQTENMLDVAKKMKIRNQKLDFLCTMLTQGGLKQTPEEAVVYRNRIHTLWDQIEWTRSGLTNDIDLLDQQLGLKFLRRIN